MKLTYVLEVTVPDETPAVDYQAYLDSVRQAVQWNRDKGWEAKLRDVQPVGCISDHHPKS